HLTSHTINPLNIIAIPEGVIEYAYDAITGRQTKMWTANTEVRYDHDNLGRLVNVAEWKRGGVVLNTPVETKYAYNDIGNVTSVMVTDGANTPRLTTHSYDPQRHWLTGVENKSAGVVVSSFVYTRRADGQMSKVVESVMQPGGGLENSTAVFTYDASNRLTKETVTTGTGVGNYTKEYILDLVGNRVELVETKGWQDPVSTLSTYNARDQLLTETTGSTTITHGYNANGSLTTKHVNGVLQSEQAWDVRGRMEGLKDASGNWTAQYRYTPEGIRSAVTEGTTTTLYVIDILGPSGYAQVIEERTAAGLVVGSYVYGPSLDPLSQWRSGGQGANLYLADGHSGVRQAVNLTGGVLLAQRFDAYGSTMATAGTLSNVIGYRGERFDNTLGQYHLRARYYNPTSGRFTGMDPFHGNYGDPAQIMRYGYAGMNPVWSVDPSGLSSWSPGSILGAISIGLGYIARGARFVQPILTRGALLSFRMSVAHAATGVASHILGYPEFGNTMFRLAALELTLAFGLASAAEFAIAVEAIAGVGVSSLALSQQIKDTPANSTEPFAWMKYWNKPVQVLDRRVYKKNDLFDPYALSDWKDKGKTVSGTNIDRMRTGRAPVGYDGEKVELHHLTQTEPGPIAEVGAKFHDYYTSTLHIPGTISFRNDKTLDKQFNAWREAYWKLRANDFGGR
ncbi:MAG: HNH/ENDO VII family nuclease, partial [Gemmataceae bacterium]